MRIQTEKFEGLIEKDQKKNDKQYSRTVEYIEKLKANILKKQKKEILLSQPDYKKIILREKIFFILLVICEFITLAFWYTDNVNITVPFVILALIAGFFEQTVSVNQIKAELEMNLIIEEGIKTFVFSDKLQREIKEVNKLSSKLDKLLNNNL